MFQHMFNSMKDMLDHIMEQYPNADAEGKLQYDQQINELKKASDSCIEQWLEFEDKLADFNECKGTEQYSNPQSLEEISNEAAAIVSKGQGYYKLFMFPQAAAQFQIAVLQWPECNLARLFLGMTHMHMQNWSEAQRQFQLLVVMTDFPKWLALGYNALGCIQAVNTNMAQAEKLFLKAYEVCPSFTDSLNNLKSCKQVPGPLSLYFGSTELCCL